MGLVGSGAYRLSYGEMYSLIDGCINTLAFDRSQHTID